MREKLDGIMARHTGKDMDTIRRDTDRDFFMDGEQAVRYGIVDKVIEKHSTEQGGG